MALQVGELFASLKLDDAQFNSGLGQAQGRFGEFGGRLVGMAAKYATQIGAAIGAAMSVKTGVEYNAMMEQSSVAWNTLLGNATEAKDMLQRIADFAKSTPFETADVDMMAKYMHNAGYEGQGLFDQLMKISDVASAFAIPAADAKEMARQMSQVQQAGVAYTEDLNILGDRGVPIYKALSEQMHVSVADVKKMASEGKITSDIYMAAFSNISNSVKGASDAQSKTFTGMVSTMKDQFNMLAGYLSKPMFDLLKDGMTGLTTVMGALVDATRGDSKTLVDLLDKAFGAGAGAKVMGFINAAKIGMDQLKVVFDKAGQAINGIFQIFMGNGVQGVSILTSLGLSPEIVVGIANTVNGIKDTVSGFVSGYISAVKRLFQGDGNIGESFKRIFGVIRDIAVPILQNAVEFIKSIIKQVKQFWDQYGAQIMQAIKNFWNIIATIFEFIKPVLIFIVESIWNSIKGVIQGAINIIKGIILIFTGILTLNWSTAWDGIKSLFFGALEFIWNLVQLIMIGKILAGIKAFIMGIVDNFNSWVTAVKLIWEDLGTNLQAIVAKIGQWITSLFKGAADEVSYIWTWLRNTGANVWNAIWNTIRSVVSNLVGDIRNGFSNAVNGAVSFFQQLPGSLASIGSRAWGVVSGMASDIISSLRGMASGAIDAGLNVMTGLLNGLTDGVGSVMRKARSIANDVVSTIRNALKINSPSKVTTELGMFTAQGLEVGMDNHVSKIKDKAAQLAKAATPKVHVNDIIGNPAMAASKYSATLRTSISVPVHIDGKQVALATAKHVNVNHNRNKQTELRARGIR